MRDPACRRTFLGRLSSTHESDGEQEVRDPWDRLRKLREEAKELARIRTRIELALDPLAWYEADYEVKANVVDQLEILCTMQRKKAEQATSAEDRMAIDKHLAELEDKCMEAHDKEREVDRMVAQYAAHALDALQRRRQGLLPGGGRILDAPVERWASLG